MSDITEGMTIEQRALIQESYNAGRRDSESELTTLRSTLADREAELKRMREALLYIRTGKTHADNEHPMGEYFSMMHRFHAAAKEALTPPSTPAKEQA